MKKQSRTVPRHRQSPSPASRHLPLVDILIDTQAELQGPLPCSRKTEPWRRARRGRPKGASRARSWPISSCTSRSTTGCGQRTPDVPFERYADDIVAHCRTETQAQQVLSHIKRRLAHCRLDVHPEKTRIVYCKDDDRSGQCPT